MLLQRRKLFMCVLKKTRLALGIHQERVGSTVGWEKGGMGGESFWERERKLSEKAMQPTGKAISQKNLILSAEGLERGRGESNPHTLKRVEIVKL